LRHNRRPSQFSEVPFPCDGVSPSARSSSVSRPDILIVLGTSCCRGAFQPLQDLNTRKLAWTGNCHRGRNRPSGRRKCLPEKKGHRSCVHCVKVVGDPLSRWQTVKVAPCTPGQGKQFGAFAVCPNWKQNRRLSAHARIPHGSQRLMSKDACRRSSSIETAIAGLAKKRLAYNQSGQPSVQDTITLMSESWMHDGCLTDGFFGDPTSGDQRRSIVPAPLAGCCY